MTSSSDEKIISNKDKYGRFTQKDRKRTKYKHPRKDKWKSLDKYINEGDK